MEVTAWIDDHLCGQTRTLGVGGQVVYAINVLAEDAAVAIGCGAPGREIMFHVGTQVIAPTAAWDNGRLWKQTLQPNWRVFLPLILRAAR